MLPRGERLRGFRGWARECMVVVGGVDFAADSDPAHGPREPVPVMRLSSCPGRCVLSSQPLSVSRAWFLFPCSLRCCCPCVLACLVFA
jgi:hypothetical protein